MLGFSLAIAGSFSLGSRAADEIEPLAITAARFAFSIPLMGIIALVGTGFRIRDFAAPWRYAVCGALMAAYFVFMFEGLKTASAVSTSAVFTLTPVMSGLFGWILLRQVTTPRMAFAISIGAVGALWVIFRADFGALFAFRLGRGEAIFLVGCMFHALYTPLVRKLNWGESSAVFVFGMTVTGAILLTVYGWQEITTTDWLNLPSVVWGTVVYLTVVSTTLTFLAVNYAALRLPAAKVMAYTYLTPTWVIIWEGALGNGLPQLAVLIGVAATIAALLILLRD